MTTIMAPIFALSVLLFLPSLVSARTDNWWGRNECYMAFALAKFDIFDFESYPNYFNDDSVMQLAQTGEYYGAAGIEEYVRFGSPTSPYIEGMKAYDKNANVKTASDPETGECVMTVVVTNAVKFSPVAKLNQATTRSALLKLYFEPTSYDTISISKIWVFYEESYLNWFFGDLLNKDQTRDYVCTTMQNSCPDTWALNGLSTVEECKARLAELPAYGDNVDVSGDTQGCRVLHAAFAEINDIHCPHISFVEQEDINGKVKCQSSRFRSVDDMFDDDDMAIFDDRRAKLGLGGSDMAAQLCNCATQNDNDGSSLLDGVVAFYNGLLSIGPLPETWELGTPPYCEICNLED